MSTQSKERLIVKRPTYEFIRKGLGSENQNKGIKIYDF